MPDTGAPKYRCFQKHIGLLFLILPAMVIQVCLAQSIPWALSERMSAQ